MPFDSSGPGSNFDPRRIKPIYADMIGDNSAGGNLNVRQFIDFRRAYKAPVRLATTANHALSGLTAIDGVTPIAGDRILARAQTSALQNGIYVAAAGAWARSGDLSSSAEAIAGSQVFVTEGTTLADSGWVLSSNGAIALGTDPIAFVQFAGGATGTTVSVAADITAAKALTGLVANSLVLIQDWGTYRFVATQPETPDDETIINVTAGGQLTIESSHPDSIYAYITAADDDLSDRLDAVEAATGTVGANGVLATLTNVLTAVVSLDFPALSTNTAVQLTASVPGARVGDAVCATPATHPGAGTYSWDAFVSANDTVAVVLHNVSGAGTADSAARNWRLVVMQF